MKNESISEYEGITFVAIYIWGAVYNTNAMAMESGWLIVMISTIISIPILIMYSEIIDSFQEKDFFDILEIIFGNLLSKIIIALYIFYFFFLGATILRNFMEYVKITTLSRTPQVVTGAIFALMCAYGVKKGIESLANWAKIFFIICIIIISPIILFMLTRNPHNVSLLPIFYNGMRETWKSIYSFIMFPITELIVFLPILNLVKDTKMKRNVLIKGIFIATIVLTVSNIGQTFMLGGLNYSQSYFPTYLAMRRIRLGDFIQRIETAVSATLTISVFVELCICLIATSKGLSKLFNFKDYKNIVTPVAVLTVKLSFILYASSMELLQWNNNIWSYYALPFQIIFPVITFIIIKIKSNYRNSS